MEETSHCKVNPGWKGSTSHPRGKQWLTVYRAPQVGYFGAKNGNISRSVNSFGTGAIFWPRLGQDLSGNAFVGPFLFSGQKNDCRKDFCMTHKMTKNYKKSNFSESLRDSARRLPGWFQGPLGVFEACWNDFPRWQTKMTRRAFLALRVILLQRKFTSTRGVKKSGISIRKMKSPKKLQDVFLGRPGCSESAPE